MADQDINTGGGSAIQGSANTGGGPFAGRDRNAANISNTVRVDIDALEDVKARIASIELKQIFIERDVADLKEGQKEHRAHWVAVETKIDAVMRPPTVTLLQVVTAVIGVICFMAVILIVGIYLGGLH